MTQDSFDQNGPMDINARIEETQANQKCTQM